MAQPIMLLAALVAVVAASDEAFVSPGLLGTSCVDGNCQYTSATGARLLSPFSTVAPIVPEAPFAATVTPYSGTELHLNFTPPQADGGSQVTSYRVDWDDDNGVLEVQTLRTTTSTGPNEIQTFTTAATDIDEMQSVHTRATNVYEVQKVKTFANMLETLGGSFTLGFDTTATGGGAYITAQIPNAALPTRGGPATKESLEEILEALPNINDVTVSRSIVDEQGGYEWLVTFVDPPGDVPQLTLASTSLSGGGAGVVITTPTPGNEIYGTFRLGFGYESTVPIPYDATPDEVKSALEALIEVDVVQVKRTGPDVQNGYSWSITFVSDANTGDVPSLTINSSGLYTSNPSTFSTFICTDGSLLPGGSPCATVGSSVKGNWLSGTFSLAFTGPPDRMPQALSVSASSATVTNIPYNASEAQLKSLIEAQAGSAIGTVSVTRSGPDPQRGYTWTITYTSALGDVPEVIGTVTGMAVGAVGTTVEVRRGTLQEVQRLTIDGGISAVGGTFTLQFLTAVTAPISADITSPNKNCTTWPQTLTLPWSSCSPSARCPWCPRPSLPSSAASS